MDLINSKNINDFFEDRNYKIQKQNDICNNKDTIFITAGIQPLIYRYKNNLVTSNSKLFISQPVIRTQYIDSISEGSSLAFVNLTSSSFNDTEENYNKMVSEWYELFYELGYDKKNFEVKNDIYVDNWDDLLVEGKRTFHYYNGIEIGDTTFFYKTIFKDNDYKMENMSDLGFGLERLRWIQDKKSYYDLYSNSNELSPEIKALLSALALLLVNDVKPSNKNTGYRFRLFAKRLVKILNGKEFSKNELTYLNECITYWKSWQNNNNNNSIDLDNILKEYNRNCNRYYIDYLNSIGYNNIEKININVSKKEFILKLHSAGVKNEDIERMVK